MKRTSSLLVLVGLGISLTAPSGAAAQRPLAPAGGEPPTAGVRSEAPSLVSGADASSLDVNPAALGLMESWSLVLRHAEMKGTGRVTGGGDALHLGFPLPLLPNVALGLGLSWLRPAEAIGYTQSVKVSLGLALQIMRRFSIGIAYHSFVADGDPHLDDLSTLDVGLVVRPLEWLGAGLVVRDLTTPVYDGLPLQRVYDLELVARPLRTDRLELGAGIRIGERRGDLDPYLRFQGDPLPGLRLFAVGELMRRDFFRDGHPVWDVRVTAGLAVAFEQVAATFSTVLGRRLQPRSTFSSGPMSTSAARAPYQGIGVSLKLQGARRRPLASWSKKILTVSLKGDLSQQRWIRLGALLRRAQRRADIRGVLFDIDGLGGGWALAQELRRWIKRLRRAGKRTYAYLHVPNLREYYAAAGADRVMLDPAGHLRIKGMVMQRLFLRELLDKIGVSPQYVRIAEFKSAPEMFTRRSASDPARRVTEALLGDLYNQVLHDLAHDRKKTVIEVKAIINEGPLVPEVALKKKLVDEIIPPDKYREALAHRAGGATLTALSAFSRAAERWPVGPGIAVIVIDGDIVRGKSTSIPLIGRKVSGDTSIAKALGWARVNDSVKAVVLRVNSPGGSAMASDRIWRAVVRLRKVKPVIVSMGDMAASGGYYAACGADRIFAEAATFTGSIGIYTGKFDLSRLLRRVGIGADLHTRGKRALIDSFLRPFTEKERAFVLSRLQHFYRAFLQAVGGGRKMTMDQVHEVARGHVWTGKQAMSRGLVDSRGGLADAVDEAKRRAGLSLDRPIRTIILPRIRQSLVERVLSTVGRGGDSSPVEALPRAAREALRGIQPVLLRASPGEPLARVPYEILVD